MAKLCFRAQSLPQSLAKHVKNARSDFRQVDPVPKTKLKLHGDSFKRPGTTQAVESNIFLPTSHLNFEISM